METVLKLRQVYAGYKKTDVLQGLSFEVQKGQVFGVIGPNGCGKTTMLNVLSGTLPLSSGSILFEEKEISRLSADARCRLGIGRTFQIPRPFGRLSVLENVRAAGVFGAGLSMKEAWEEAIEVLKLTGLIDMRDTRSGELTLLDRKRLEIARAVAGRPRLLLLDEVAAGLTGEEVIEVMDLVALLKERGFTIIWIEHIIETMVKATDHLLCMAQGKTAIEGLPEEVMHSREVLELYLGKDAFSEKDSQDGGRRVC